jgi:hypothetical protein
MKKPARNREDDAVEKARKVKHIGEPANEETCEKPRR